MQVPREYLNTLAGTRSHTCIVHPVYLCCIYHRNYWMVILWLIPLGTSLPLMGVQQASEGTTPQPAHQLSPAINDVSDNLRAKLYVLCNRIGRRDLSITAVRNCINYPL